MSAVMLEQLIRLNPHAEASLQLQLRKQIADAILRGSFPSDAPLPSSRKLASQLKIARNTVVLAYEHLEDDGYIVALQRRGYFVNPDILRSVPKLSSQLKESNSAGLGLPVSEPPWGELLKTKQSDKPNISKPRNWQSYRYPFIYGQFDSDLFPAQHWRECCRDSVNESEIRDWASDHFVDDDPMLINEIRTRILPRRGIWVDDDQILITVGTQQALYTLCQMLLSKDSVMGIENPGYTDIKNIVELNQANLKLLDIDDQGLKINEQLEECDCVFVTPSHQAPTTVTLPLERRIKLLELASEHNFLVIEDDYECETSFASEHTPALKSLDREGRVIYTGSFSKTLAPGLRLGYLVASKEVIQEAMALRRLMLRHPPANNQRAVALFIARGYYDSLASKLLKEYKPRWQEMGAALARHLPESSVRPNFGGSSYWVKGPKGLDAKVLQERAQTEGLLLEPGNIHFFQKDPPRHYFRLAYSSIKREHIEPGLAVLAKLIDGMPSSTRS